MKLRKLGLGLLFLSLFSASVWAEVFEEGVHYTQFAGGVKPAEPTVTEFFSFTCPHCYRFESQVPTLKAQLAQGVAFEQYHVDFGRPIDTELARSLVIAQQLNVSSVIKPALFAAIHETKSLRRAEDLRQLFLDNGVSAEQFDKASSSFVVQTTLGRWKQAQQASGLRGVPAIVVNQQYLVDRGSVKTVEELAALLNYLANKG
ncbi:thiol:disulfide interchange protein DsbA/DsbL [Ferrimonas pelagia]|uniref:Thiol:disulfide interchange protein n=1 Tax=Ferrimonas pelagia TaxID=1177826 RepID=A0ABP9EZZ4_9GAMM